MLKNVHEMSQKSNLIESLCKTGPKKTSFIHEKNAFLKT